MKQLKYVSLFLLAVVLSASFTSCSDDEKVIERDELVGTWQCIIDEGYERYESKPQSNDEWNMRDPDEINETVEFKADGTMIVDGISHTWSLKEDILVTVYKEGTYTETIKSKVLKLTSKEFITERSETSIDEDDGGKVTFWNKMTFKKIK